MRGGFLHRRPTRFSRERLRFRASTHAATARDLHSALARWTSSHAFEPAGERSTAASPRPEHERAAAQAQRFRVYERCGYYRPGLCSDRDAYDTKAAAYVLALLPTGHRRGVLLGSARVILGDARAAFRFPAEHAFEFELPETIAAIGASQRVEVTRVVAEPVQGIVIGGLLIPLGLIRPSPSTCGRWASAAACP